MRKNIKLPTILGLVILIVGVTIGVYLVNSRQIFKLGAQTDTDPRNVRVSNITDASITITWTTNKESSGFVKWGESGSKLNKISSENATNKSFVHSIDLLEINPGSDIFFTIGSDEKIYDNNGMPWQTKTNSTSKSGGTSLIASGNILQADASTPANAIVYLTINGTVLSNITSFEGSWIIPISNYIESVAETTAIEISADGGIQGTAQAVIYPKNIKAVPIIILGKTYDFRTLEQKDNANLPESSVSVPESIEKESRFETEQQQGQSLETVVTLDSIDEGEIITTTDPEFFGKGPSSIVVEVLLESNPQSGVTAVGNDGEWSWSPPSNLEPGEHTITVKWTDATGIVRMIQRNFVVSASEGPAFESTPSATPVTVTPTSTPVSTSTTIGTAQPVPETGSLTPTVGLFIMGIGLLLSGFFVWNKSNVY